MYKHRNKVSISCSSFFGRRRSQAVSLVSNNFFNHSIFQSSATDSTLNRFFTRSLTKWTETDLPLHPRVSWSHKTIKQILEEPETGISEELKNEINRLLAEIRKINWHEVNDINFVDSNKIEMSKNRLKDLIDIEKELPKNISEKLDITFEDLKLTIKCIDQRHNGSCFSELERTPIPRV